MIPWFFFFLFLFFVFFFSFFFFSFLSKDISLYRTNIDNSDFVIFEVFILLKNSFYYYYIIIIIIIAFRFMTSLSVLSVSGMLNLRMFWREVETGLTVSHDRKNLDNC